MPQNPSGEGNGGSNRLKVPRGDRDYQAPFIAAMHFG